MSSKRKGQLSPADGDYDVPFFTVAHYKSPTAAPTTYEFASPYLPNAVVKSGPDSRTRRSLPSNDAKTNVDCDQSKKDPKLPDRKTVVKTTPETTCNRAIPRNFSDGRLDEAVNRGDRDVRPSHQLPRNFSEGRLDQSLSRSFPDSKLEQPLQGFSSEGAGEALCSDGFELNLSPVRLAFGPSLPGESWWPPDDIISPSETSPPYQLPPLSESDAQNNGRRSRTRERTTVETIREVSPQEIVSSRSQSEEIPVRQSVNFTISPPSRPKCRKKTPEPPNQKAKPTTPNGTLNSSNSGFVRAARVYEDASVSDAGEFLFPSPGDVTPKVPDAPQPSLSRKSSCKKPRVIFEENESGSNSDIEKKVDDLDKGTKSESAKAENTQQSDNLKSDIAVTETKLAQKVIDAAISKLEDSVLLSAGVDSKHRDLSASEKKNISDSQKSQIIPLARNVKPQVPPKPSQQQIESASRRNSAADQNLEVFRLSEEISIDQPTSSSSSTTTTKSNGPRSNEKSLVKRNLNENSESPLICQDFKQLATSLKDTTSPNSYTSAPSQSKPPPTKQTPAAQAKMQIPKPLTISSQKSRKESAPLSVARSTAPAPSKEIPGQSTVSSQRDKASTVKKKDSTSTARSSNEASKGTPEVASRRSTSSETSAKTPDVTPRTPRTPRSKSREPSFCLELDYDEFPQSDAEYLALLHAKIAEAHERQLLPLKEDVADWLAKLLGEDGLTHLNLLERLGTGVLLCRLADVVSTRAQEARQMGLSELEIPRLPYKTWERARQGSFFARDNISNFLRFCRRLGVHDNLLFETEDLVSGSGARTIVLCLLEVGRLAQNWWGLEPPAIVKLERELEGEEWSARSDSGYSNASSPRGSTLALHPSAPSPPNDGDGSKPARPRSAPCHLPLGLRLSLPSPAIQSCDCDAPTDSAIVLETSPFFTNTKEVPDTNVLDSNASNSNGNGSCNPSRDRHDTGFKIPYPGGLQASTPHRTKSGGRGPKPTPPPKPESIKQAMYAIVNRPDSLPGACTRGWSGSKTTPSTPVLTPTHTPRTRLPIARTPRTSGRSTPNTTPTTPTQCRRYLSSVSKQGSRTPNSKIPCRTPGSRTPQRQSAAFVTPQKSGRPPVTPASVRSHCVRAKEDKAQLNRDLDNRVADIARQTRGVCACKDTGCTKTHIKKLADGKYDVYGKSVYVRLLKDRHVMVRVGGGWDTLEHYVLSHDPTQVMVFNSGGSEPFLHIRSRYRSPTPGRSTVRAQQLTKRFSGSKPSINDDVPSQPDFDNSFGSSQSLSDGSSTQSELTEGGEKDIAEFPIEEAKLLSAIECLSKSMSPTSKQIQNSSSFFNGDGLVLEPLEESPTDIRISNGSTGQISNVVPVNGGLDSNEEHEVKEDILSPCPCGIVPPLGAVTESCPPEVLAVSLTDSCSSHSLASALSNTESANTGSTVINTQVSLSDSVSSSTLLDGPDNTRMADSCDSISSMERSQELGETAS